MQSAILGMGNESDLVLSLTFLKSVQNQNLPSRFRTEMHGELQLLCLSSFMSFFNMYWTSLSSNSLFMGLALYGCCLIGAESPTSTSCSIKLVLFATSGITSLYRLITSARSFLSLFCKFCSFMGCWSFPNLTSLSLSSYFSASIPTQLSLCVGFSRPSLLLSVNNSGFGFS